MRLTGTQAKRRCRFPVSVIGALIAVAQQLHLYLFHLRGVVGPNLRDKRVVGMTKGVEGGALSRDISQAAVA